jgi:hypothetical protein
VDGIYGARRRIGKPSDKATIVSFVNLPSLFKRHTNPPLPTIP